MAGKRLMGAQRGTVKGRRVLMVVGGLLLAATLWVVVDLGSVLVSPSQESAVAKTAEWARARGLGGVVTLLEQIQYQLSPPATGGAPDGGIPLAGAPVSGSATAPKGGPNSPCDTAPLASPAGEPLPNEGAWQPLETVHGRPAILAAFVRPDAAHTQFVAGVTCIDQSLASFALHPGTELPGGTGWAEPSTVAAGERGKLLATFNSGFLVADSMGGYWQAGKSVGTLTPGLASMVFTADGRLDVRAWEGGTPDPNVVAVRQNLTLLVDHGHVTDPVLNADSGAFGRTLGDSTFVWRSAVGIRADGSIVTVHGNALSVQTLAQLLVSAGAVRGMELDINKDWTSYIYYQHGSGSAITPVKLTNDQVRAANRYLQASTRDFVAVTAR